MADTTEEPAFNVLGSLGEVELREYGPSIQAQTTMRSNGDTVSGFRKLAGFIFGGNNQSKEIAMTAPVQETLDTDNPVMTFTMPSEYQLEDLPEPNDGDVIIREVPSRTVAVTAFSGWATDGRVSKRKALLLATLAEAGIEPIGTPALNQYNPPWTLPFLRRNEVEVEIDPR